MAGAGAVGRGGGHCGCTLPAAALLRGAGRSRGYFVNVSYACAVYGLLFLNTACWWRLLWWQPGARCCAPGTRCSSQGVCCVCVCRYGLPRADSVYSGGSGAPLLTNPLALVNQCLLGKRQPACRCIIANVSFRVRTAPPRLHPRQAHHVMHDHGTSLLRISNTCDLVPTAGVLPELIHTVPFPIGAPRDARPQHAAAAGHEQVRPGARGVRGAVEEVVHGTVPGHAGAGEGEVLGGRHSVQRAL